MWVESWTLLEIYREHCSIRKQQSSMTINGKYFRKSTNSRFSSNMNQLNERGSNSAETTINTNHSVAEKKEFMDKYHFYDSSNQPQEVAK